MANSELSPIDRAQECVTKLTAIDSLIATGGNESLSFVTCNDLGCLLRSIRMELDEAITELARNNSVIPLKERVVSC